MKLCGKTVLITGAARRLGREIALTLARRGAAVVIHFNRSRAEAFELKRKIEGLGSPAYLVQADLSCTPGGTASRLKRFVQAVRRQAPRVDILINNAAIFYPTPFGKVRERDWDNFMTVNLKFPFFLAQEFGLQMMKCRSGKIVNLVDWTGLRPHPRYLPYAVSKAGLIALTTGLAKALAPYVQVNSVAPGAILPFEGMSPGEKKAAAGKSLLKRFGDPRDIAETVCFLIEDTDYITGALIPVDGGSLVQCI